MQDYHVYAHYVQESEHPRTSAKYMPTPSKTEATKTGSLAIVKEHKTSPLLKITPRRAGGLMLGTAAKINNYVGELSENRLHARRNNVKLTYAGFALIATSNPTLGLIAAGIYTADKAIEYGIKNFKENIKADFMKTLSGGTVGTGR